ncbi:hypothetical protein EYF80_042942 [Liparis tanakae]|uniref:Uncharacterized protein n=1 Tax=Liparis tanakae TaxID=230148 RepID=A0A4Z2G1R4_9TELE|nr:hypothetical protein EYF80_042942 [Liparis tanakae]
MEMCLWARRRRDDGYTTCQTYLGMGAAGPGAELQGELRLCRLLVEVGVWVESWARCTLPMRYQMPMLLSSL